MASDLMKRLSMTHAAICSKSNAGVWNIQIERKSRVGVAISQKRAAEPMSNHDARFDRDEPWQLTFEEARL